MCTVCRLNDDHHNFLAFCPLTTPQASKVPLPPEAMSEIFEDIKDMGVLIGKGGLYGQVTAVTSI